MPVFGPFGRLNLSPPRVFLRRHLAEEKSVERIQLDGGWLVNGLHGVTPNQAATVAEAAAVCWEYNHHADELDVRVDGDFNGDLSLRRLAVTEQMRRGWADFQDAVESAACAVAFVIVVERTSYTVLRRSRKGTGFDYWLGEKRDPLFQDSARLEVSGILRGGEREVARRMNEKKRRLNNYPSRLPALIVIAEFSTPKARVSRDRD